MSKVRELAALWENHKIYQQRGRELREALEADEAEAVKTVPAMPDDIREIVETTRLWDITPRQQEQLLAFLDAAFPKPVPQWELDAQWVEKIARGMVPQDKEHETMLIAERIREASRGK